VLPLKDLNPPRRKPILTYIIVAMNVAVFFLELAQGRNLSQVLLKFGFVPYNFSLFLQGLSENVYLFPLFTSMFLHGGWAHIIGNMWYLVIFGDNVEDRIGKFGFLLLYIFAGIAAAIAQFVISPTSKIPMVGASGAISGILGAYIVFFPGAKIVSLVPDPFTLGMFFRIIPINAVIFLLIWFLIQLVQGVATIPYAGKLGGTAFWAHIGGFAFGLIFAAMFSLYSKLTGIKRYRVS
jgi:membrane associated rhomboid family serine protease